MTIGQEPGRLDLPSVLVLGGGRWARVITQVLLGVLTDTTPIRMVSPAGAQDLARWTEATGWRDRIEVLDRRPEEVPIGSVAIVANAAHSHVESTLWALQQGASTLVEKPFAPTPSDVQHMSDTAAMYAVFLAPALVFRFASYLDDFREVLAVRAPVEQVELVWADAAAEHRHGEAKRYDPGVSVIEDCLPHVISVFNAVFGTLPAFEALTVERGGAKVRMSLAAGLRRYDVVIERNAVERQRILRAFGASGVAELNFTEEPGTVVLGGVKQPPTRWPVGGGPMVTMIGAFLKAATGGPLDERLSIRPALHASQLTDASMLQYRQKLIERLAAGLAGPDLDYAVAELLQRGGRLAAESFERAAAKLERKLTEGVASGEWSVLEAAVRDARGPAFPSQSPH